MLREYPGGYDDWLRSRPKTTTGTAPKPAAPLTSTPEPATAKNGESAENAGAASRSKRARLSFKEIKELAELPARIETLEKRQAEISALLADPKIYSSNAIQAQALQKETTEIASTLATTYARWDTLEAKNAK